MTVATAKASLGELLIERGIVTQEQLTEALATQASLGLPLGETLIRLGMAKPSQVFPVLQSQLNVPWADLSEGLVDTRVVRLIPQSKAERYGVLAMFRVRNRMTVAMSDPRAIFVIDEFEQMTGFTVQPVLVSQTDVRSAIKRYYAELAFESEEDAAVSGSIVGSALQDEEAASVAAVAMKEEVDDKSPIVNLVNVILTNAAREGASDVHIEPARKNICVRYRIDGALREVMTPKLALMPALISRLKVMTKMDIAEHRRPQDGRTMIRVDSRQVDVRASCMPTTGGEKMALRLLDRDGVRLNLEDLGMRQEMRERLQGILAKPHGMILATGPTGSGKTTTLYCLLDTLRGVERNVVSIEDPVEYELDYVNQVQVNESIGLTFASVLRTFLRQDPDYIMVGEIRDQETAKMAVQAALTGHLVLSTLHTNDSVATVARLMNIGIDPMMLAAGLTAIIAQRLVRTNCPKCTQPDHPSAEVVAAWRIVGEGPHHFKRGTGCAHCFGTGLRGRMAIYELLTVTEDLKIAIGEGAGIEHLRSIAKNCGLSGLAAEGGLWAAAGRTTMEEVLSVVDF